MTACQAERRRILALIDHNDTGPGCILYLRARAFAWVDLLPMPEAQERATDAIGDARTSIDLRRILEQFQNER